MGQKVFEISDEQQAKPFNWFACIYFFWMGGSSSIAYGSVSNSFDYFKAKFPNDSVTFIFPIGPYVANMILIALISYLSTILSYKKRIIISVSCILVLTAIIPFEAYFFPNTTFGIVFIMGLLLLLGFFSNMCYASMVGFTSQIGREFTTYFMIGVASFGLAMNLIKEGTILLFNPSDDGELGYVVVYFAITMIFIAIGLVMHIIIVESEYFKTYLEPNNLVLRRDSAAQNTSLIAAQDASLIATPAAEGPPRNFKTLFSIFLEARVLISLMILINLQHNTFYPGVMLLKTLRGWPSHTETVVMITVFSAVYIVGKKLGQYRPYYNRKIVFIVALIRFLFDGAFVAQVLLPTTPILETTWFAFLNVALFGITLGFLIVALFIMIPEDFPQEKKEIAGFVAVIGNNLGSMVGTFLSLPLKNL